MTFTQTEVDAFRQFMLDNKGMTRMKFGDREYEFSSLAQMESHLKYMEANLDSASTPSTYTRYASTSKGLGHGAGNVWRGGWGFPW